MATYQRDLGEVPVSWFFVSLRRLIPYYIELICLAFFIRLLGTLEPFIYQALVDRVLPFQRESSLLIIVSLLVLLGVFHILFDSLSKYLGMLSANNASKHMSQRLFDHYYDLPTPVSDRWGVGETTTRIQETETVRSFLIGSSTGSILDLVFLIIYCTILYVLSPILTFIVLIALPLQMVVYVIIGPFLRKQLKIRFQRRAEYQGMLVENVSSVETIKTLRIEGAATQKQISLLSKVHLQNIRVLLIQILSEKSGYLIQRILLALLLFVGARQVFSGALTLGELLAFIMISQKVGNPLSNFAKLWESWQNVRISRSRLGDIILEKTEHEVMLPDIPHSISGELTIEGLGFDYGQDPILDNISFTVKPKTLTLISGPSGVGKSTLGKLIAGLLPHQTGSISLDGHDLSSHNLVSVRRNIAYVAQDSRLFSGTIRDNFLLVDETLSDAAIQEALRAAGFLDLHAEFPQGLDTFISENGASMSGGQKQRFGIARALVSDARVLVLDEPTSALDPVSKNAVCETVRRLRTVKTVIVVTHRAEDFKDPDLSFALSRNAGAMHNA